MYHIPNTDLIAMDESEYLEHFGVPGMKWGVRKQRYDSIRNRKLADFSVTTKHGEKLQVTEDRSGRLASFINSFSDKKMKRALGYRTLAISHDGKKIGDTSVADMGGGELNLVWLGINPKHRGKGYASAVFKSAIKYGTDNGFKKLTLEVPGNSPDARHIYEKNGFKVTHEATKAESEDDVWGGLTNMEYDIDHIEHSDLTSDPSDDLEEALEQTFPKLPTDVANEVWKDDIMHSNIMTESEYLEHFGIPGMKWGKRKALQPSREKMRAAESIGSLKKATGEQRHAYKQASSAYYNKKRKLKGKNTVNDKTAAYRQDIKNDIVKGSKYLGTSFVTDRAAYALSAYSRNSERISPFLSDVAGISSGLLKGASVGAFGVGAYYSGRSGVKRIRGGKNGDRK